MVFECIVVGTDGSAHSREAVRRAVELARLQPDPELHVVAAIHVLPPCEVARLRDELPEQFHDLVDQDFDGEARVGDAFALAQAAGVEMVKHVSHLPAADAILDVAERIDADLIVVGARGLGPIGRFLRGSVSTKVAHRSPCDVLIVEHGTT